MPGDLDLFPDSWLSYLLNRSLENTRATRGMTSAPHYRVQRGATVMERDQNRWKKQSGNDTTGKQ